MAFATVAASNGGGDASDQTSRSVPMPSGITAGDLLLVFAALQDTNTGGAIADWTVIDSSLSTSLPNYLIVGKIAEGSDTATLTSSKLVMAAYTSLRITGFNTTDGLNAFEITASSNSASAESVDPPSLNPTGWDSEDTLWLAVCVKGDNQAVTDPADYTRIRYDIVTGGTGGEQCGVVTTYRELAAASTDPGTFSWTGAEPCWGLTAAIRPAGAAGHPTMLRLAGIPFIGGSTPRIQIGWR